MCANDPIVWEWVLGTNKEDESETSHVSQHGAKYYVGILLSINHLLSSALNCPPGPTPSGEHTLARLLSCPLFPGPFQSTSAPLRASLSSGRSRRTPPFHLQPRIRNRLHSPIRTALVSGNRRRRLSPDTVIAQEALFILHKHSLFSKKGCWKVVLNRYLRRTKT